MAGKLRTTDNWGRITYLFDGVEVDKAYDYVATVMWPDGKHSTVDVVSRKVHDEVEDMGHLDRFTDARLVALVDHHGHTFEVPLEKLHVLQLVR